MKKLKPELMQSTVRRAFIELIGLREAGLLLTEAKKIPADIDLDYDKIPLQAVDQGDFKIKSEDPEWKKIITLLTKEEPAGAATHDKAEHVGNRGDGQVQSAETKVEKEQLKELELGLEIDGDGQIKSAETVELKPDQPKEPAPKVKLADDGQSNDAGTLRIGSSQPGEAQITSTSGSTDMAFEDAASNVEDDTTSGPLKATSQPSKDNRWKKAVLEDLDFKFAVRQISWLQDHGLTWL